MYEERIVLKFHISDILSITSTKMVSVNGIDGIYSILDYMTGDSLYTHQLPETIRACRPRLLEQFPQLSVVNCDEVNSDNLNEFIKDMEDRYGKYLEVL
ncbi:MAG: hypothetical protein AB2417_02475 [Clostridiaceae bacterium]